MPVHGNPTKWYVRPAKSQINPIRVFAVRIKTIKCKYTVLSWFCQNDFTTITTCTTITTTVSNGNNHIIIVLHVPNNSRALYLMASFIPTRN